MKLKYVKIKNFRSIESAQIDLNPSCRSLVGINESGKSNILKAISMIGEGFSPKPEDVREPLPKERSVEEAYIWFVFELEKSQTQRVFLAAKNKVVTKNLEQPLLEVDAKNYTLNEFCVSRKEGLYCVDVKDNKKYSSNWAISENSKVLSPWKKPSAACPADFKIQIGVEDIPLKNFSLVNQADCPDIPNEYLEEADPQYVNCFVCSEIKKIVLESLPKVIFWQYDEKNLLPSSVDIDKFIANPDSCLPLKNMFTLAGVNDIKEEITQAKKISANNLRNLLNRVANHTTSHFKSVWKEYKEIRFALEPNGNTIEPNIVEKNHWRMAQRSDGFKRFITFLLHISANVKTNVLSNVIILADEPDVGLHPTGSRYLRDELIKTAIKNYVVFSTHSIFMIDKDVIDRHLIVKKQDEKTSIKSANKSNFVDEEVLFNALNYTVFDVLQKNNIIFEGWKDKKFFQTALMKIPDVYKAKLDGFNEKLKQIGLCHAEGVKDVRNITPLLELADRKCIIISDGDTPAKDKQKDHLRLQGYGIWKRYDEVCTNFNVDTVEDFLKEETFKKHTDALKKKYPVLTKELTLSPAEKLSTIKKWMLSQGVTQVQAKESLDAIKEEIFDDLKVTDIGDAYYDFLVAFSILIDSVI